MGAYSTVIISGPSGSGQDSVIGKIGDKFETERVITYTTRPMREGESRGNPYYFVSEDEFRKMISSGEFVEWAEENGRFYGTTKAEIVRVGQTGRLGVWKIEIQGVMNAKRIFPCIPAIMIWAEKEVLEKRIRGRDQGVSDQFVEERLKHADLFFRNMCVYDFIVQNEEDKLDITVKKVETILRTIFKKKIKNWLK